MSYGYTMQMGHGQVPAGVDQNYLAGIFQSVDKDRSGQITAAELQQALVNGAWTPFNPETVKLIIGMFDMDCSGTVNFQEFMLLWKYIMDWHSCFRAHDRDGSGFIDRNELRVALSSFGYNLSERFYDILIKRFDRNNRNTVAFDDFVQGAAVIQALTNGFRALDTDQDGWINITHDQLLISIFNLSR